MAKKKKISLSKEGFLWKGIPELIDEENKKLKEDNKNLESAIWDLVRENRELKKENKNLKMSLEEKDENCYSLAKKVKEYEDKEMERWDLWLKEEIRKYEIENERLVKNRNQWIIVCIVIFIIYCIGLFLSFYYR